ncbi:MAG TPA: hypothetical protein VFH63_08990 [candidate division Zixibacteria bacterium]|nr:hypothetical protein [candidate division Zixibacteria bacterium]
MRPLRLLAVALLLAGCAATPTVPAASHVGHDPQADRVKAALAGAFGMTFESAGPHHELGRTDDGVQLDLVGAPVEQVVLSLPEGSVEAGAAYLPHLRDLLHGPASAYDWAADVLACHATSSDCEERFAQGNLEARVTREAGYVVLSLTSRSGPG